MTARRLTWRRATASTAPPCQARRRPVGRLSPPGRGSFRCRRPLSVDGPTQECLVRFGEVQPDGSFGTYRIWMTAATRNTWTTRSSANINGRPLDVTFVYNDQRTVYNAGAAYNGSDNTSELYDAPDSRLCGYTISFPADTCSSTPMNRSWTGPRATRPPSVSNSPTGWPARRRAGPLPPLRPSPRQRPPGNQPHPALRRGRPDLRGHPNPWRRRARRVFPGQPDRELFKLQVWRRDYKFPPPLSNSETYHCSLEPHRNLAGQLHLARYRWNWRKRAANNIGQQLHQPVRPGPGRRRDQLANYDARVEAVADIDQWMRTLAFERCIGNFDKLRQPQTATTCTRQTRPRLPWLLFRSTTT